MKIKQTYKYMMLDLKNTIINYYIAIVAIYLLTVLLEVIFSGGGETSMNIDGATVIFLFIVGLCSFKDNYLMLAQNGISRRTMFVCRMLTAASIAAITMAADQLFIGLAQLATRSMPNLHVNGLLAELGANAFTRLFIGLAAYFFCHGFGVFHHCDVLSPGQGGQGAGGRRRADFP